MCLCFGLRLFSASESTTENIRADKHAQTRCCSSSCQQPRWWNACVWSYPWHDAHIPNWEAQLCILITASVLSRLAASPPGLSFQSVFFWLLFLPDDHERVQLRVTLQFEGPTTGSSLNSFFPRMYINASHTSGGISTGNCRDSPPEQDDDIVLIVFLFFPAAPSSFF